MRINAEAAYVATQALATEYYGKIALADVNAADAITYITVDIIKTLTSIKEAFTATVTMKEPIATREKENCIIDTFTYIQPNGKVALCTREAETYTVTNGNSTTTETSTAGGWIVG